jgi:aspartate/methionine/tyrosine aminotransferase
MKRTAARLNTVEEYYFSMKLREVRALAAGGKPIINMGVGSPDLAPSAAVIQAIRNSMDDPGAHQYQSYQGLPELRQAISDFYKEKFGVAVDPAHEILPLMGSKEGIMHISMAFINEGDKVLIPDPGYPTYTSVTQLVGGVPEFYDLSVKNNWFPDLKALSKKDLSGVKLMLVSYPHIPTGATSKASQIRDLLA